MSRRDVFEAFAGAVTATVFGITWPPEGLGPAVAAAETRADFAFVVDTSAGLRRRVAALHAVDVAAFVVVPGPVGVVAQRAGMVEVLKRSMTQTLSLAAELSAAADESAAVTVRALEAGADGVIVADDLAHANGWLLDPDFVTDIVVGLEAEAAAPALDAGARVAFHSDGDISALCSVLAEAGFSAVHLATGEASTTRAAVVAALGAALTPLGGIAASDLGAMATAQIAGRVNELTALGLTLVCDDGGITTYEQSVALAAVFDRIRALGSGA